MYDKQKIRQEQEGMIEGQEQLIKKKGEEHERKMKEGKD